jgi:hypothetical protein
MLLCDVPAAPAGLAPCRWQGAAGGIEPAVLRDPAAWYLTDLDEDT